MTRQYIHLGYQRLLGFEVRGGGFDWFGNPPANQTLTAYGLMEFEDMAKVHDVDPRLIERTRNWLLGQRQSDSSWRPESRRPINDPTLRAAAQSRALSTTAYIAWAVYRSADEKGDAAATLDFLLAFSPEEISSPYVLALVCNAMLAIDETGRHVRPYLDRLVAMKKSSDDGKLVWWEQGRGQTTFYGQGRSAEIETTALATLALLKAGRDPGAARGALAWLVKVKDAVGTWHSTQATVLALKALVAGSQSQLGGEQERRIQWTFDDEESRMIVSPADQSEVMRQVVLRDLMPGEHLLKVVDRSDCGTGYQVTLRYHVPDQRPTAEKEPLTIDVQYDRTELAVNDTAQVVATVVNNMSGAAPMVMVDLPIPPGFTLDRDDFRAMIDAGNIEKFEVTSRSVIVYLRNLSPGEPLVLRYELRATMPLRATIPAAVVYLYYDPDTRGLGEAAEIVVTKQM